MNADPVIELATQVHAYGKYQKFSRRDYLEASDWYDWQHDYFRAGKTHSAVMCLAGNQSGKTQVATYEQSLHITCDYPDWWEGDEFDGGGVHWVFGVDATQMRDVVQKQLFGEYHPDESPGSRFAGGGWVHPSEIKNVVPHPNKKGLLADVFVVNKRGGVSAVSLRTYTQTETGKGTLSFAGAKVDSILVDEQPPDALTGQLAARRAMGRFGKGGSIRYTMTPELGLTDLVRRFMEEPGSHQKLIGPIGWNDCEHMTEEKQAILLADIPQHEHDMRSKGVPFFGSGMVFPVGEGAITCDPFEIPGYFKRLAGLDIGIDHPTAVAWLAYDADQDIVYVTGEYRQSGEAVATHASAIKRMSGTANIPVVFPHDADQREKGSGKTVRTYYEDEGLTHCLDFKNPDGSNYVEPGIMALLERMRTGRFKVFSNCNLWFREFRGYHRKNGKIVPLADDLMSATRYGAIMVPDHGVTEADLRQRFRKPRVISD